MRQPLQRSWNNPMGTGPAGNRGPRELVDIKGSLPSGFKMMQPDEQAIG